MRREMSDMHAELLVLRGQQRRARQPGPEARIPKNKKDHQDASGDVDRTEGVVGLTRWIEKMESVFNISGCAIKNQVKFATCTLLGAALTWWNGQIRTLGPEAYAMTWEVLKKKMIDKYCPQGEIKKLEIELWNLKKVDKYIMDFPDNSYGNVKSPDLRCLDEDYLSWTNDLMIRNPNYAERQSEHKGRTDEHPGTTMSLPATTHQEQKCHKGLNNRGHAKGSLIGDLCPSAPSAIFTTMARAPRTPKGNGCFECGAPVHFKRDCPKLKNMDGENGNAQGWVYAVWEWQKTREMHREKPEVPMSFTGCLAWLDS
ncbi:putative reverse transcriptase domain-containing protein [Tanacetum coccineum]